MTRDEAVTVVTDRLGQRTGLTTQIINELKLAQAQEENSDLNPWFLEKYDGLSTAASNFTVSTLNAAFLRFHQEGPCGWILESDGSHTELAKHEFSFLRGDEDLQGTGKPEAFTLVGDSIYLFKAPNATYNLRFLYLIGDAVLSTNIENNWLKYAPGVLINWAGIRVARFLRDPEAIEIFAAEYAEARKKLITVNEARRAAGIVSLMGG